jgi:putative membrane protein
MDAQSAFQRQYPLSPRKFIKKTLSKWIGLFFILILEAVVVSIFFSISAGWNPVTLIFPIIGMIYLIYVIGYCFYIKAYINRYYYDCGPDFITIKKRVFAPTEIHVQYQKIQDVYVDQDIFDRMLGLYDVHIASATIMSGIEAHIDGVDSVAAEGIKNFLLGKITGGSQHARAVPSTDPASSAVQNAKTNPDFLKMNSDNYPISAAWLVSPLIGLAVGSILFGLMIMALYSKIAQSADPETLWIALIASAGIYYIANAVRLIFWRRTYRFEFLPDFILFRQGFLFRTESHVPYRAIQDVAISQGVIQRMFGISNLRIENAARGFGMAGIMIIPGQSTEKANEISDFLKKIMLANSNQGGMGV